MNFVERVDFETHTFKTWWILKREQVWNLPLFGERVRLQTEHYYLWRDLTYAQKGERG